MFAFHNILSFLLKAASRLGVYLVVLCYYFAYNASNPLVYVEKAFDVQHSLT